MDLRITTTPALIAIETKKTEQSIKQPKADLEIHQEWPEVSVELTLPQIQIDQKKCFSESGLKRIPELIADNAAESVQSFIQTIGKIAEQGNQLAAIQNGGNVIAQQAIENSTGQFSREIGMVTMPKSRPNITVIEGKNDTKIQGATVDIKSKVNSPEISSKPGKVDVYLRQINSINIEWLGGKFDNKG